MVAVLVGEHVELDEAAVGAAELPFEHLVEEGGVEVDRLVGGTVERADRRVAPPQPVSTEPVKV